MSKLSLVAKGVVAATLIFAASVSVASASTVTLDFGHTNDSDGIYIEDGFKVSNGSLIPSAGNCTDPHCLALGVGDIATIITDPAGGKFTLSSLWFNFQGAQNGSTLRVASDKGYQDFVFQKADKKTNNPGAYDTSGQTVSVLGIGLLNLVATPFINVAYLTFSGLISGNLRIDDVVLTPTVAAVPLPAGLPLLGAALGGLGLLGWRRKKAAMALSVAA